MSLYFIKVNENYINLNINLALPPPNKRTCLPHYSDLFLQNNLPPFLHLKYLFKTKLATWCYLYILIKNILWINWKLKGPGTSSKEK